MFGVSEETLKHLREEYPKGTRVALVSMDDPYGKLVPGDEGTVSFVDDAGQIHVGWDRGSSLALVYGVDQFRKLS